MHDRQNTVINTEIIRKFLDAMEVTLKLDKNQLNEVRLNPDINGSPFIPISSAVTSIIADRGTGACR